MKVPNAALPPIADAETWQSELDTQRARKKAATREYEGWLDSPDVARLYGQGSRRS